MSEKFEKEVDCRGLSCPMPILNTKKAMDTLKVGQVLKMIATDPGSVPDIQAWTSKTGHTLLGNDEEGGTFTFYIKKTK